MTYVLIICSYLQPHPVQLPTCIITKYKTHVLHVTYQVHSFSYHYLSTRLIKLFNQWSALIKLVLMKQSQLYVVEKFMSLGGKLSQVVQLERFVKKQRRLQCRSMKMRNYVDSEDEQALKLSCKVRWQLTIDIQTSTKG